MIRRLGISTSIAILALSGLLLLHPGAVGQDPRGDLQPYDSGGAASANAKGYPIPDHVRPQAYQKHQRRSIVHHYPYPYPGYYHNDDTAGFRNPGGVGRHAEYYLPGDRFQVEQDPIRVAKFDQGGGAPDRAEQLAAQRIGIQRANSIQGHIDSYARPYFGFGFGVGGFGGFW